MGSDSGLRFPLPPAQLLYRSTGGHEVERFLESGQISRDNLERALSAVGVDLAGARRILDFGCGCGRVLRWLSDVEGLHGLDIDEEAIAWASEHLPFAEFHLGNGEVPTEFEDGFFDLVINHSVFTHLDAQYQDRWLGELQRISAPDAILVLSVNAELAFHGYELHAHERGFNPQWARDLLEQEGIVYMPNDEWTGVFPDFYHSTFHAPWYVLEHWQQWFELAAYIPRGNLSFQDTVVLRNSPIDERAPLIPCRRAPGGAPQA